MVASLSLPALRCHHKLLYPAPSTKLPPRLNELALSTRPDPVRLSPVATATVATGYWAISRRRWSVITACGVGSDLDIEGTGALADFGCDENGCTVEGLDLEAEGPAKPDLPAQSTRDFQFPVGWIQENSAQRQKLFEDPSGEFASVKASEVTRFLARPTSFIYNIVEVTSGGEIRKRSITRGDLLKMTGLRPRDLRAVAVQPVPGSDAAPMLAARRSFLLIGIGGVRALVEHDRALLFGPPSKDRARFLRLLENQRRALFDGEIENASALSVNFRMIFVESALLALSRRLDSTLLQIRQSGEPKLRAPPVLRERDLEEVRQLRRSLGRAASQASAVSSALLSRLDSDEAVQLAGGEGADDAVCDEWEAMLEAYLQAYSQLSRECVSLQRDMEDFEGSTSLALQARRLRVEQFELSLVIASVSVGAGGIVPSAMGMNLLSGYENSDVAFRVALLATMSVVLTLFFLIRTAASKQGFLA